MPDHGPALAEVSPMRQHADPAAEGDPNGGTRVIHVDAAGTLRCGDRRYRAALGRAGVRADKREGDGATPAGRFPLRRVLYRADRVARPVTRLPTAAIHPSDGWCSVPDHASYNRKVELPHTGAGAGEVDPQWLEEDWCDVVVEIGYNDDPPVPGLGSAIFLHVARADRGPTAGCVALGRDDLLEVLRELSGGAAIQIDAGDEPGH
jgi:L,D-peptidoglycan transpeptidase YkuD (ErfK/YbiS/YcfS/YnhG family)